MMLHNSPTKSLFYLHPYRTFHMKYLTSHSRYQSPHFHFPFNFLVTKQCFHYILEIFYNKKYHNVTLNIN